jgi:glycosyltransferase involved in cell wall biosynthesis
MGMAERAARRSDGDGRMRVLHCIYDDPDNPWVGGGGAVRVREIYRRLSDRVRATVLCGHYPGARREEVIDGVRYLRRGAARPYAWSRATYARAANGALRRGGFDAAVFDFSTYTPVFVPGGAPVGITVHHVSGPTAEARWGRLGGFAVGGLERAMIRRGTRFSATSCATREHLVRLVPDGSTIDVVYAGVPDELFRMDRAEADYLLYFGRIDFFQKGLDTLLAAATALLRERPGLRLCIAGRGKDLAALRQRVASLEIADRVELRGAVSEAEKHELLRGALVQLMPSRFEGFGMVAAEAMAAGVPLVASAVDSLPEVVSAPEGGVLVPPTDVAAWISAVGGLLNDRTVRRQLSEGARAAADRFRWANVAEAHLTFLRRIAGDDPSTTRNGGS